jgi:hypothetical protein
MNLQLRLVAVEEAALGTCEESSRRRLSIANLLVLVAGPFGAESRTTALAAYPSKTHVHLEHVRLLIGNLSNDDTFQSFIARRQSGYVLTLTSRVQMSAGHPLRFSPWWLSRQCLKKPFGVYSCVPLQPKHWHATIGGLSSLTIVSLRIC